MRETIRKAIHTEAKKILAPETAEQLAEACVKALGFAASKNDKKKPGPKPGSGTKRMTVGEAKAAKEAKKDQAKVEETETEAEADPPTDEGGLFEDDDDDELT